MAALSNHIVKFTKKGAAKQRVQTLVTSLAVLFSFSLAFTTHAAETVKIALAGPITGSVAQYGDMQKIGAMMAIDRINEAGGVNGKQLEGVLYDDACDPKQAVAVANKIVNDNIRFVVGHLCSGSTQPASDIYEDEGIVMITAASTSPAISERGYQMIFRTIGLDNDQGPTAANFIADTIKPKRVAVIHDKQQYGEGIATAVRDVLKDHGVKVVMFEAVTPGQKNFAALVDKLKRNKVDFVYYGGYHPELGLILRQSAEKGLKAEFMGPEGVGNKEISTIAGQASDGLLVTLPPSFDTKPENKALVEAFKKRNEDPSGAFVMTAYAAAQIIADAMKGAKTTTDTDKIQKFIHGNAFDTPIGKVEFKENGDLKYFDFVVYRWRADGSKTLAK